MRWERERGTRIPGAALRRETERNTSFVVSLSPRAASSSPTGSPTWIEPNSWMKDGWNDDGWNNDGHKPTNGPTLEPTREPHGWNGDGHKPTSGPTLEPSREPHGWNGDGH